MAYSEGNVPYSRYESFDGAVVGFAQVLRTAGFRASLPAVMDALKGITCTGLDDPGTVRTVLKAVFTSRAEESAMFDRLFEEFWLRSKVTSGETGEDAEETAGTTGTSAGNDIILLEPGQADSQGQVVRPEGTVISYSPHEVLREADFRDLPHDEDPRIERMLREILAPLARRAGMRTRRTEAGMRVDFRKLLRRTARFGGEVVELPRLKPKRRLRRVVFLCDVSGSMSPYLRFMLLFIKAAQELPTRVETFVFATRLHRITRALTRLPFLQALSEIAGTVRDWSGGTRIGRSLQELVEFEGGALVRPSSVLVIHSDGWDRGDPELLHNAMAGIHRRVHRVIWINPLLGGASYEPTCRGMKTALPFVDSFLPGNNPAGLERLARTLSVLL